MILRGNEKIRAFLDKLTASTNVSKYVDLPMIAVMGDTSSGKSSLLSSISGVELPSASELTTRCPIMLQMNRAQARKAVITVQWKDIPEGKLKKDVEFQTKVVIDEDWDTLPDEIARAQKHIIDLSGKEVARDIVQVKIEGPHCEDLTLVDLPGIVRTRGDKEGKTIVEDIKALIDDYLSNSRCVILAVVPANVDFHNSQILADAQKVDPQTKRTIPVITKPDLIDTGAEGDVVDLLLGRKTSKFQMGFHMVKGRGQAQLDKNITIEEGLEMEKAYFKNEQPWRGVTARDLFGIENLRKKLGELQVNMMKEQLPAIIDEMTHQHEINSQELAAIGELPKSASEKRMFYREVCENVVSHVAGLLTGSSPGSVTGGEDAETIASRLHCKCDEFQLALKQSKFSQISSIQIGTEVLVSSRSSGELTRGKVVALSDDGDHYFIDYETRAKEKRDDFVLTSNCRSDQSNASKASGEVWLSGRVCIANGDGSHDELNAISADRTCRDPSWLVSWIKKKRTDDLPVFVNSQVFRAIVMKFINDEWKRPSFTLVDECHNLLVEATDQSFDTSTKISQYPLLQDFLGKKLRDQAALIAKEGEERLDHFLEKERAPYSQDHYLFESLSKQRYEPMLQQLVVALGLSPDQGSASMRKDSIESILRAVVNQNQRKSVDEHMAEEMQMILDSYSKVALKRFIDGVPMECWIMFRKFTKEIKLTLSQVSDSDLNRCLVADANVEQKREELKEALKDIQDGLELLESLW